MTKEYDFVVLGAGLAGSTTALCLAGVGHTVLVVEKKVHPRFVIGEATTPQTTLDVKMISREFNVPELQNVSGYLGMREIGCTTYPKELFWFGFHQDNKELKIEDELITFATLPPLGPDSHMLRSEIDEYLTTVYPKYGITYMDNTAVETFEMKPDFVDIGLKTYGGDGASGGTTSSQVRCKFVVDASGHNCFLSRKYGLHHHDATLRHRSRTIYNHFKTPEGWDLDELFGSRNPYISTKRDAGTMHHFFEGGWFWVIPFENGTVSVGVVLDLDMFPNDRSMSAEEEWNSIVDRFPTVKKHLGPLTPIRTFLRTGRIQITSSTILGDRFILTPHASSFIDPLYSTGIALTVRFVKRFVPLAKQIIAFPPGTPASAIREVLEPMERNFKLEVDAIDKLVHGSFAATHHIAIYRQFWRMWIISVLQTAGLSKQEKTKCDPLFLGADPVFSARLTEAYNIALAFAQKTRDANKGKNKQLIVDETEAYQVAEKIRVIADACTNLLHTKTLFDVLPMIPLEVKEPAVSPGGAASEYHIELLMGINRPRILSFFYALHDIMFMNLRYMLNKIIPNRYGTYLSDVYKKHHVGAKALKVNPVQMVKRLYIRCTGQKLKFQ